MLESTIIPTITFYNQKRRYIGKIEEDFLKYFENKESRFFEFPFLINPTLSGFLAFQHIKLIMSHVSSESVGVNGFSNKNFINSQAIGIRYCLGCRNGFVSPIFVFFLYFLLDRIFCARRKQNLLILRIEFRTGPE